MPECSPAKPARFSASERSMQGNEAVSKSRPSGRSSTVIRLMSSTNRCSSPKRETYISALSDAISLAKMQFHPSGSMASRTKTNSSEEFRKFGHHVSIPWSQRCSPRAGDDALHIARGIIQFPSGADRLREGACGKDRGRCPRPSLRRTRPSPEGGGWVPHSVCG